MATQSTNFRPLVATLAATIVSSPAFAQVTVEIFHDYVDNGSGISLSDPVGSFTAPNIDFFIGAGGSWHPYGLASFGARITGSRNGGSVAQYTNDMGITSSDGSYLFFNGDLLINNGGIHGIRNVQAPYHYLLAGANPFELQFFKSPDGGLSGLEMTQYFPSGGSITMPPSFFGPPVPEPTGILILGLSGIGIFFCRQRVS